MPAKEQIQTLLNVYNEAQEARRAIEKEIREIEPAIASAVQLGRADDVVALSRRKRELPELLIEASGVEAACAVGYYRAEQDVSYQVAIEAQDRADEIESENLARIIELQKEIEKLQSEITASQNKARQALHSHNNWTLLYDNTARGFGRELASTAKAV